MHTLGLKPWTTPIAECANNPGTSSKASPEPSPKPSPQNGPAKSPFAADAARPSMPKLNLSAAQPAGSVPPASQPDNSNPPRRDSVLDRVQAFEMQTPRPPTERAGRSSTGDDLAGNPAAATAPTERLRRPSLGNLASKVEHFEMQTPRPPTERGGKVLPGDTTPRSASLLQQRMKVFEKSAANVPGDDEEVID